MANLTLVNDYARLSTSNYEYGRTRNRLQFLLDSFVGGDDYRRAGYLTKYTLEQGNEYNARLLNTPLQNHCASIISVYQSFLFRKDIERNFVSWEGQSDVENFLMDATYEGQSFNSFMKEASQWASVFGWTWIIMSKPNVGATTLGQEQEAGVRPYLNCVSPLVVNDWTWERNLNGSYDLVYIKYIEEVLEKITILKEWTPTEIKTWILDDERKEAHIKAIEPNTLGMIPAVQLYNRKSIVKGQGVSDINDIADVQRMIYNLTSEIEQSIRLDGHPTLVVRSTDQLGSGAGALIITQEGADPAAKPYYLEHSSAGVDNIRNAIKDLEENIDKMANTGGVRHSSPRITSGIALQTEFELLNARLAEKADSLENAEEQIWELFAAYQGKTFDGYIKYPDSFSMRDVQREYTELVTAKTAASDPATLNLIDYRVRELLDDPNLPLEPVTHYASQGIPAVGPPLTGPLPGFSTPAASATTSTPLTPTSASPIAPAQPTGASRRPRRYFSSTITGLE